MNETLNQFCQSGLGVAAFAALLLAPGYLAARVLFGARAHSAAERTLWSVALSLPLALVLAELPARVLPSWAVAAVFIVLDVVALGMVVYEAGTAVAHEGTRNGLRAQRVALAAAALLGLYLLLALLDVQVGQRLFVPTVLYDWAVRVPLVQSAMHSGVPPLNPLSALNGAAVLRYYYFWYVLCARAANLAHISARAALTASAVWAAWSLLAMCFLALKYLAGVRDTSRRRYLTVLLPLSVIGLDLLPTLVILLSHTSHPYLDMEWWRNDRTPALLTTLLYAPHHIGGIVCCFVALLVLVHVAETRPATPRLLVAALLAGICFAAAAGTSTFMAFVFVLACIAWGVVLLGTRQWRTAITLAGSGVVAWLLSRPFLHEMSSGSSAATGFAGFAWRSSAFVQMHFAKHHLFAGRPFAAFIARQPVILTLDFFELGFFAFVAWYQLRTQLIPALRGRLALSVGQRALWAVFTAAAFAALFLSSAAVTLSANDLGMHAAMIVRLVLVLWSVPYLEHLWAIHQGAAKRKSFAYWSAITCLALGLAGGIYGAAMNRVYFPLLESRTIDRPIDALTSDRLSERLFATRAAWEQMDRTLPPGARVQFNPIGTMHPALAAYSTRQIVASDDGCGTAFGGDARACPAVAAQLHHLFGAADNVEIVNGVPVYAPAATVADAAEFQATCSALKLSAVMVESTDPIWNASGSWVSTLEPAIAYPTMRVYACAPR